VGYKGQWGGRELLSDLAHVYVYLQRTEDGRIAIGGRGSPYRYASGTGGAGETSRATVRSLRERLAEMFPAAGRVAVEHAWSGVLGVSRDWTVSIDADPASGLARAGGYVGEGVAAANLAGRTLADLVLGERSDLVALAWVGRSPKRGEPEPLRYLASRAIIAPPGAADRREDATGRQTQRVRLLRPFLPPRY